MNTMGEVIAQKRKELGMTQAELAAKMNVTDKAVSKWERGISCPDIHSLSTLAQVLGLSMDQLLSTAQPPAKSGNVSEIIDLVFKAVSLAMGVAVAVLGTIGKLETATGLTLLGLGLTCQSIWALNKR